MCDRDPSQKQISVRVLVAPLDWGLGHATRCIPVIYEFLRQGASVTIATDGAPETLLKKEFPQLNYLTLIGYNVTYSKTKAGFLFRLIRQLPRLINVKKKEQRWLQKTIGTHPFDVIVSDNRFGLYSKKVPAIFITHQLHIKSPLGKWMDRFLQKINYRFINRFTQCWVPDDAGLSSLAGALSHPIVLPLTPVKYIGPLSRLKKQTTPETAKHLFISLSGPEPQRSILEKKIRQAIKEIDYTVTLVCGLPGEVVIEQEERLTVYNHLDAVQYAEELQKASFVICRGGYSTIMDVLLLQKKAVLIPTPGQGEQEYLAQWLQQNKLAIAMEQHNFSLVEAIARANAFTYATYIPADKNSLQEAIADLLATIRPQQL